MLVLSELVTNAMVHARAGCTVEMTYGAGRLRSEVSDPSQTLQFVRLVSPDAPGGYGLQIVDAIAEGWGLGADGRRQARLGGRRRPVNRRPERRGDRRRN